MSFRYSRHLSSNTPVDVFTVVGKYKHVLDVNRWRPSPGYVFRAVDSHTCYVNILESSSRGGSKVQRRFVDLDAPLQTQQLSPEECGLQPYVQACSATSQVVCFIDSDITKIADNYIAWIKSCDGVVEEPVKPTAVIILCGPQSARGAKEIAHQLSACCTNTKERSILHSKKYSCFNRTEVLDHSKLTPNIFRNQVNWSLLNAVRAVSVLGEIGSPASLGYCWRELAIHQIFESSISFFAQRKDATPFSIARALTASLPSTFPDVSHLQAMFLVGRGTSEQMCSPEVVAQLLGMYMAHHVLAHCPLLDLENFRSAHGSGVTFFDFVFGLRYAPIVKQLLEHTVDSKHVDSVPQASDVRLHMDKAVSKYLSADACVTRTHLASLSGHHAFFTQQSHPKRLCTGCLFAYWDDVLLCRHGFCKACTHNHFPKWKHSARLQIKHCPACLESFCRPFDVKIQPPTAGGRVLSLDGGGVKGAIELEILREISVLVGAHLPLDSFFDMAIGTSIGECNETLPTETH